MLEEIAMPRNPNRLRRPFFPFADNRLQLLIGLRKGNKHVHMIRHKHRDVDIPNPELVAVLDCFEQRLGNIWKRQMIPPTRLATNRDEIAFFRRIDPERHIMRKSFANWQLFHAGELRGRDAALRRPRTAQRAVPTNLQLLQQRFPARPGIVACFLVLRRAGR